MKTMGIVAIMAALVAACVVQQVRIAQLQAEGKATPSPPPAITYDVELLAQSLQPPDGATDVGPRESHVLLGQGYGTSGFDGCLWIDVSKASLGGEWVPEFRLALVADFYAQEIVNAIPGAFIERAIDRVAMAEAHGLHSTYIVRHPDGHVVVSAGYVSTGDTPPQVSNVVKVHVISINNSGNARTEIMPSVPKPAP
jgi:hypothetical protein